MSSETSCTVISSKEREREFSYKIVVLATVGGRSCAELQVEESFGQTAPFGVRNNDVLGAVSRGADK